MLPQRVSTENRYSIRQSTNDLFLFDKKVLLRQKIVRALILLTILALIAFWLHSKSFRNRPGSSEEQITILISIDGFNYDYIFRGFTPTMAKLANEGIMRPIKPQFPSYTFPNHYSIVTGLYPESHGILSNDFINRKTNDIFSHVNYSKQNSSWWLAEPLWNSVEIAGKKSATISWPGSDIHIKGHKATYNVPYSPELTEKDIVNQILAWISMPAATRPTFIAVYLSVVDTAGHFFGPNSKNTNDALKMADEAILSLLNGISRRRMEGIVNLAIVSDHGMAATDESRHIHMDDIVPRFNERVKWHNVGTVVYIEPKPDELQAIYEDLKSASSAHYGKLPFKVYLKEDVPEHYRHKNNKHISPIVLVAEIGWYLDLRSSLYNPLGVHGYDPSAKEMRAIFIGHGPQFKANTLSYDQPPSNENGDVMENLDLYPLLAKVLKIDGIPNNGTNALLKEAWRAKDEM